MKISNLRPPQIALFLASMEDVTDPSFRLRCKEMSADMMLMKVISADGLSRDSGKYFKKLDIYNYERPICIQIYAPLI